MSLILKIALQKETGTLECIGVRNSHLMFTVPVGCMREEQRRHQLSFINAGPVSLRAAKQSSSIAILSSSAQCSPPARAGCYTVI